MQRAIVLALVLALAGCSGLAPVPDGIPVDEKGNALPTMHGFVVDEAIRPLAGVIVRFLGTDVNATTDDNGEYRIFEPVDRAHLVLLSAFKVGYSPSTKQVQVSGTRSLRTDFGLEVNPYAVPHIDVFEHRGIARCDGVVSAVGEMERVNCQSAARDPSGTGTPPPWIWDINPTPGLAGVVVEVHWNPVSPVSERLHAWLMAPMAGGQGGELVAEASSTSPIRLEVPADLARSFNQWTSIGLHVDLADPGGPVLGAGIEAAFDQRFEAFATVFYVDPAPEGYTLT